MTTPRNSALNSVEALQAQGLFLSAHDQAMTTISKGVDDDRLKYLAVLTLARAGATMPALSLLRKFHFANAGDPDIAGLEPRLLKDVALASRDPDDAKAAGIAYQDLWECNHDSWYGVNAAAMALLTGDPQRSRALASAVRRSRDLGDYWSAATLGEAALLMGDESEAAFLLLEAEFRAGNDLSSRATTRRQLTWEADLLHADPAIVNLLRIPDTIHYCGLIPGAPADENDLQARLEATLRTVGFAYGGLAAGADIVTVEMLIARGTAVTVILPFPPEIYLEHSVRPAGEAWVSRYQACLERVTVQVLETTYNDDLDFGLASRRAMGLACLHARQLEAKPWQLAIWGGEGAVGPAGTAADVDVWRATGGETREIDSPWPRRTGVSMQAISQTSRTAKAVVFGDLPHFSELDDASLLAFYAGPLAAMGLAIDKARPLYRNAWGDAVQLVFDNPSEAAHCAFRIRAAVNVNALTAAGLAPTMVPRLAIDFGGLHAVFDAVQQVAKFAGRVMTRAARIEPVTPPGTIYVTEAFACETALKTDAPYTCDYAGRVPLAKNFGIVPLYALRETRPRGARLRPHFE